MLCFAMLCLMILSEGIGVKAGLYHFIFMLWPVIVSSSWLGWLFAGRIPWLVKIRVESLEEVSGAILFSSSYRTYQ